MKVLFILYKTGSYSGGAVINDRNFFFLQEYFGKENVLVYEIYEECKNVCKLRSKFISLNGGVSSSVIKSLIKIIKIYNIQVAFIANSVHGLVAKKLRTQMGRKICIISFFHNVEYLYLKDSFKIERVKFPSLHLAVLKRNESFAVKYSDIVIALNKRDSDNLSLLYQRSADFLLPTSLNDDYSHHSFNNCLKGRLELLFVGSEFYANVHGIQWFIDKVMPKVRNVRLTIVGSGIMDKLKCDLDNVSLLGRVDSLDYYYKKSDIVVLPIFLGSGMKTKTAEALMYGKPILATKEALQGYEVISIDEVGYLCDSESDFISAINLMAVKRRSLFYMQRNSRRLFKKHFSNEVCIKSFKLELAERMQTMFKV